MKRFILLYLLVLCYGTLKAQQQVSFTQYMFNGMAINPGYIGSQESLSMSAVGRWQWLGMEGAPTTQTLAIHSPVPDKNIGLGLQITRDQIAVTNMTSIMAGYAYRVPIANGILSMGVQGGLQSFRNNYSEVYTIGADPTFQENTGMMLPNFGTGIFYYNPVWYAGLSSPILLNSKVKTGGSTTYTQKRHYFFTSGAALALSPTVVLKPNVLVKVVEGAPVSVDYNLNVLLNHILWLGVSLRPPESVSLLMEVNVNQRLRLGYAYDHIIDQTLSGITQSSHEILLGYRIALSKNKVVTPRYF